MNGRAHPVNLDEPSINSVMEVCGMGQAKIISGGPKGLYNIEIVQETAKANQRLLDIAKRLTDLLPLIENATSEVPALKLELFSLETEKKALNVATRPVIRNGVWCADLTTDLPAGKIVDTIFLNGDPSRILIAPGGKE